MTKSVNVKIENAAVATLAIAMGSLNEWELGQMLRNLCFSTAQDAAFQAKIVRDLESEARAILEGFKGGEIEDFKLVRLQERLERHEQQSVTFGALHNIVTKLFKDVTGSEWTPPARKGQDNNVKTAARMALQKRLGVKPVAAHTAETDGVNSAVA